MWIHSQNAYVTWQEHTVIFDMFTKIGTVYVKQNENSRSVIILTMNVLCDMSPNVYDLSKEVNENWHILGDQNASVLSSY